MKKIFNSISFSEWRFIGLIVLAVIFLTGAPVVLAYLSSTDDRLYNGLHAQTSVDLLVYFSYIKQVISGQILVFDNFTGEAQNLGTFNLVWFGVGLLGRIFKLTPPLAYHLSRLLLAPLLLGSVYLFIAYIFSEINKRKLAFTFCAFASGLGFYFIPVFLPGFYGETNFFGPSWWPLDLWITEINIFNTIYQSPHFILSWTCLIWIFLLTLLAIETRKYYYPLLTGLVGLVFFNFHPYYVPLVFGVMGLYGLYIFIKNREFDWRLVGSFVLGALISSVSIIYHFWLIQNGNVIGARAAQNVTLLFHVWPAIVGFGLILPLGLGGLAWVWVHGRFEDKTVFLLIWLGTSISLLFAPVQFQSRYFEGLQFPLVIFSVIALNAAGDYLDKKNFRFLPGFWKNPYLLAVIFFLAFCLTNFFNLSRDIFYAINRYELIFFNRDQAGAYKWLDQQPQKGQLVLSAEYNGHVIPGFSGQKVFFAHGHETLGYDRKKIMAHWFYANNRSPEQKKSWLESQNIDYVFFSLEEKQWGGLDPATQPYLELVYDSARAKIYRVIKD